MASIENPYEATEEERYATKWILGTLFIQFACQIALIMEQFAAYRVVFRSLPFLVSVAAVVLIRGSADHHPARTPAILICLTILFGFFNPLTPSPLAAVATFFFYLAILAPVFWAPRLDVSKQLLLLVFMSLYCFHTASATVGVLQIRYPGRFQPALSTVVQNSAFGGDELKIQLADGSTAFRPMGLTDLPGGAGIAGFYAVILGIGMLATRSHSKMWVAASCYSIYAGAFCLYMSHIRSLMILTGLVIAGFIVFSFRSGRPRQATIILLASGCIAAAAMASAFKVGGSGTIERVSSLVASDPIELYSQNRGHQLQFAYSNYMTDYPFGAGLGKWGMISYYFNDSGIGLWAEIQWSGWLLDGGLPLVILYSIALSICILTTKRLALEMSDNWLQTWGLLILSYDLGLVAQTFGSVPFSSQSGLEFWLLNSVYFVCVVREHQSNTLSWENVSQ